LASILKLRTTNQRLSALQTLLPTHSTLQTLQPSAAPLPINIATAIPRAPPRTQPVHLALRLLRENKLYHAQITHLHTSTSILPATTTPALALAAGLAACYLLHPTDPLTITHSPCATFTTKIRLLNRDLYLRRLRDTPYPWILLARLRHSREIRGLPTTLTVGASLGPPPPRTGSYTLPIDPNPPTPPRVPPVTQTTHPTQIHDPPRIREPSPRSLKATPRHTAQSPDQPARSKRPPDRSPSPRRTRKQPQLPAARLLRQKRDRRNPPTDRPPPTRRTPRASHHSTHQPTSQNVGPNHTPTTDPASTPPPPYPRTPPNTTRDTPRPPQPGPRPRTTLPTLNPCSRKPHGTPRRSQKAPPGDHPQPRSPSQKMATPYHLTPWSCVCSPEP
jgi:hypothetical protein